MQRSRHALVWMTFGITALATAAACVDLFHATDFRTACNEDAAACAAETGVADALGPETEGSAPTADLCAPNGTAARDLAEHACSWLGACLGTTETSQLGACMTHAFAAYDCDYNPTLRPRGELATLWRCLSGVTACNDVEACVFGGPAPKCNATGPVTACGSADGGPVMVACVDTETLGMDPCVLRGRTCASVDMAKAICAGAKLANCKDLQPSCQEKATVVCKSDGGIDYDNGIDCAAYGDGRCVNDGDGSVACAPNPDAGTCAGTTAIVCKGGDDQIAESCVEGNAVRFKCKAIGMSCTPGAPTTDPASACAAAPADCTTTDDGCDGASLTTCLRGRKLTLRCTDLGLGACVPGTNGHRARCGTP